MNEINGQSIMACSGNFYDSGDSSVNYGNNESYTVTFFSNSGVYSYSRIFFNEFDIQTDDTLFIYDGPNTSSTLIGAYNNSNSLYMNAVAASVFNPSGGLTLKFSSNNSSSGAGWKGLLSCNSGCQSVLVSIDSANTTPSPIDSNRIEICLNDTITLSGTGVFPQNGILYFQDNASSTFEWNFGDGTTATGQTVFHNYNQDSIYSVSLKITDNHGCMSKNSLGTKVRIGSPAANLAILQSPADSVFCIGDVVFFYPIPNNSGPPMNSTYEWFLNGNLYSSDPTLNMLFNQTGIFNLAVKETNYGCPGTITNNITSLEVLNPPAANFLGPAQVCLGDTLYYHALFSSLTHYEWTSSSGTIVDTSNNELYIRFDTVGIYTIDLLCMNKCGQAIGHRNVMVSPYPDVSLSASSNILCSGEFVDMSYTGTSAPPLSYVWDFNGGVGTPGGDNPNQQILWNSSGHYLVSLTVSKYGCESEDSIWVTVNPVPQAPVLTQDFDTLKSNYSSGNQWYNQFGEIIGAVDSFYLPTVNGVYYCIETDSNGCISDTSNIISFVVEGMDGMLENVYRIDVFPNPLIDILNLQTKLEILRAEVINMQGKQLYVGSSKIIDCREFPKGMYFVLVTTENGVVVKRFVKD